MTYMAQYHRGTMQILEALAGELEQIGALGARAAEVIGRGNTVWTSMDTGHMPFFEHADDRRGNPGLFRQSKEFPNMKKGDLVFTNFCHREVLAARERGVYVVCVTTPYWDNEFRPAGFTDVSHGNPDGLMLKDVSNEILHTHMPYQQGLVDCPEIPEFRLCPCATTGGGAVHWMLNAEAANKVANPKAASSAKAKDYLAVLTERTAQTTAHMDRIQQTAQVMATRIISGGRWFAESIEHPGFKSEFNVACGPRMVNDGDWDAAKDKNVMVVTAISPAFAAEVAWAKEKKAEGAFVIGIGPASLDGVVADEGLFNIVDAGFDNFSPESGGVVEIPGRGQTICPTSGVIGNLIQQMLNAQWAQEMINAGTVPTFMRGIYQSGGNEYNSAMAEVYQQRGY
jgi:hypothetical protein